MRIKNMNEHKSLVFSFDIEVPQSFLNKMETVDELIMLDERKYYNASLDKAPLVGSFRWLVWLQLWFLQGRVGGVPP